MRWRMLPGILLASLGIAGATPPAPQQRASARAVLPMHDGAWRCGPAGWPGGSQFAVVSGNPMRAESFTIRVELPSGYRLPSYRRPRDESIVVLAGSIEVDTRTLRSGSFIRLRADEWHSLGTNSGGIVQIFGDGPFEMNTQLAGTGRLSNPVQIAARLFKNCSTGSPKLTRQAIPRRRGSST